MISQFDWIRIQVPPGASLTDAVMAALEIAKSQRVLVRLEFNGAPLAVAMDSNADDVVARYVEKYAHLGNVQV